MGEHLSRLQGNSKALERCQSVMSESSQAVGTKAQDESDAVPVVSESVVIPMSNLNIGVDSGASRSGYDRDKRPTSPKSVDIVERREDADICVIRHLDDDEHVYKLKQLLTRFVTLQGGRKLVFFSCEQFGEDLLQWLDVALKHSRFKFIYVEKNQQDEWVKFQQHFALWDKIIRRDQSIVPVKAHRGVVLPNLLGMFRALDITQLLRGKTLDEIGDVANLTDKDVDSYFLQGIARMFNQSPASVLRFISAPVTEPAAMSSRVERVLRKHYQHMVEHMDPDSGLLGHLYSSEVISARQKETIAVRSTFYDKNEELLKILLKLDINEDKFNKLIDALKKTNQDELASVLSADYSKLVNGHQ